MSQLGRFMIHPEDIQGNDGTVRHALELLVAVRGPLVYNAWQSAYFSLIRVYRLRDAEAPEEETRTEQASRVKRMYAETHQEIHGPDYLAQAVQAMRDSRVAQSSTRGVPAGPIVPLEEVDGVQPFGSEGLPVTNLDVERFDLTPRSALTDDTLRSSPDRVFTRGAAAELWEEDWGDNSEISEEFSDRMEALANKIGRASCRERV